MLSYNKNNNNSYYLLDHGKYDLSCDKCTYKLYYVNNLFYTLIYKDSNIFNVLNYIRDNNILETKVIFKDFSLFFIKQLSSLI